MGLFEHWRNLLLVSSYLPAGQRASGRYGHDFVLQYPSGTSLPMPSFSSNAPRTNGPRKFYDNFYNAIRSAGSSMDDQLAQFSSTFAPQGPATVDLLKILLDTFAVSYGLIGAGVWNKILRDAPIFKDKGNDHAWAKDSANAAVANGVTLAKDAQPGVKGEVDTLNDIRSELGKMVDGWANVTQQYMSNLFSGTDDGLTQLDAYVNNGSWADTDFNNSLFSLQGVMENVLYGSLIPKAWAERNKVHPVVVFQQGQDITNPLTTILQGDAWRTLSDDVSFFPILCTEGQTLM